MKVLIVITESEIGGAQVHVLDLISGCRESCSVALATGDSGYLTQQAEAAGVKTYIIPGLVRRPTLLGDMRALLGLVRLIRRMRPDVVHVHTYKAGLLGRWAASLCRVPVVYTAHSWCFNPGTGVWWKKIGLAGEWISSRLCFRIISVSEANKTMALSFRVGSAKKIETIHNGIRDLDLRARPASSPPYVVMVARFVIQKDQMSLISALAPIKQAWRLRLIGDGPTRELVRERARMLGVEERVEFLGERDDVAQLLAASSIFALITHMEGLPLTILEAMRAGLPVVASDVGGVCETIDQGRTGYLVPHDDTEALRMRLEMLIHNPELRARLGTAAREKYERDFGYGPMLKKTLEVYRAACGGRYRRESPPSRLVAAGASESQQEPER